MFHSFGHLVFDTFQQLPTMLDPLDRPVWANEKILEIITQRDTSIIRNLKKTWPNFIATLKN